MSENLIDSKKKETNKNSLINSSNYKIYSFEYNLISYELKTNSKNHQYIKSIIQIKNNGSLILPQNCKIMNSHMIMNLIYQLKKLELIKMILLI